MHFGNKMHMQKPRKENTKINIAYLLNYTAIIENILYKYHAKVFLIHRSEDIDK